MDEIGDMPFDLQTRLLRVLSDGHFYRVGGHQPIKSNVRVIAATHQNLEQRVQQGLFREDLYHRLNVIRLRLPSLRERREDIPLLTRHFLHQSAQQLGVESKRMSEQAMQLLSQLTLPGNVRQLENLCNWIVVMAPAQTVEIKDLPPELLASAGYNANPITHAQTSTEATLPVLVGDKINEQMSADKTLATTALTYQSNAIINAPLQNAVQHNAELPIQVADWLALLDNQVAQQLQSNQPEIMDNLAKQFEAVLIKAALKFTHGRKNEAAIRLGIGRNTITRKLAELGIESKD